MKTLLFTLIVMLILILTLQRTSEAVPADDPVCYATDFQCNSIGYEPPIIFLPWTNHSRESAMLEVPGWVFDAIVRKRQVNIDNGQPVNMNTHFFWAHRTYLATGMRQNVSISDIALDMGRTEDEILSQIDTLLAMNWAGLHDIDWTLYP